MAIMNAKEFKKALDFVTSGCKGIDVYARNGRIENSTDDRGFKVAIGAKIPMNEEFYIGKSDYQRLKKMFKIWKDGDIDIKAGLITDGKYEFKWETCLLDKREYSFESSGTMSPDVIAKASKITSAVSKDETRQFLCGVFFDKENSSVVATDGKHLAFARTGIDCPSLILPVLMISKASKLKSIAWNFHEGSGADDHVFQMTDGTHDITARIETYFQFPNWQRVVPDKDALLCHKGSRLAILESADCEIATSHLKTRMADGMFGMTSYSAEGDCSVPAFFNPEYVKHAMEGMEGDTIDIRINPDLTCQRSGYRYEASSKASVFEDGKTVWIIMPMATDPVRIEQPASA